MARDLDVGGASEGEEGRGEERVFAGKADKVFQAGNPFFEVNKKAGEPRGGSEVCLVKEISTEFTLRRNESLITTVGFGGVEVFSLDLFETMGEAEESRFA